MNKKKTINTVKKLLQNFSIQEIEKGIYSFSQNEENEIANFIKKEDIRNNIETIIDLFECLVDKHTKSKNGVVFTPKYISDYIVINSIAFSYIAKKYFGKSRNWLYQRIKYKYKNTRSCMWMWHLYLFSHRISQKSLQYISRGNC